MSGKFIKPLVRSRAFEWFLWGLFCLPALLLFGPIVTSLVVPGEPVGKFIAARDVARGHYELKTYGLPAPWRKDYAKLLNERYGIKLRAVAGCVVSEFDVTYSKGYNSVQRAEIARKFGYDVTTECATEAEAAWTKKMAQPSQGIASPSSASPEPKSP